MDRSTAFDYANGIDGAVEIITAGTAIFSSEHLAGQYAFEAARDGGLWPDWGSIELEAQLDYIESESAVFDKAAALRIAEQFAADAKTNE